MDEAVLERVLVTPEGLDDPGTERRVREAIGFHGVTAVILRQRSAGPDDYGRLASRWVREAGVPVILHGAPGLAARSGAFGVHLGHGSPTVSAARALLAEGQVLGVSVHGVEEGRERAREGADYLLLGPLRETPKAAWKRSPLGFGVLRELASSVDVPVVGIGGLLPSDLAAARERGAAGVAAIRGFLDLPMHGGPDA